MTTFLVHQILTHLFGEQHVISIPVFGTRLRELTAHLVTCRYEELLATDPERTTRFGEAVLTLLLPIGLRTLIPVEAYHHLRDELIFDLIEPHWDLLYEERLANE